MSGFFVFLFLFFGIWDELNESEKGGGRGGAD